MIGTNVIKPSKMAVNTSGSASTPTVAPIGTNIIKPSYSAVMNTVANAAQRQPNSDEETAIIKSNGLTQSQQNYYKNQAELAAEQGRLLQSYMNRIAGVSAQSPDNNNESLYPTTDVPTEPVEPTNPGTDNGGGSNGGGSVDNSAPVNDYWSQYYAALQAQQEAQRQQTQEAYDRALANLENSYNNSRGVINQNADDALRQAYINSQLSRRGLANELANQGINGGAVESILANLLNAYGNNRNSIEQQRANNLTSLQSNYDSAVADAGTAYANGLGNIDQNYYNALASGLLNQAQSADSYRNVLASRSGGSSGASNTVTPVTDNSAAIKAFQNNLKNFYDKDGNLNADGLKRYISVVENTLTPDEIYEVLTANAINPADVYGISADMNAYRQANYTSNAR